MALRPSEPAPSDLVRVPPEVAFAAGLRHHHLSNTAYPIAHQRTFAPYRVPRSERPALAVEAWDGIDDFCLYAHVPFCESRCAFCEYAVVSREESVEAPRYVDAVLRELELWDAELGLADRRCHGFDIGGGTPTFLPGEELCRLVEAVRERACFTEGADISIETTPRLAAGRERELGALRRAGVERISMGVQVADRNLARELGRDPNGVREQRRAVESIRGAGFLRLNVDLMYGFAGQSLESWRATLEHATSLEPDAITLYRMRYKQTRIADRAARVSLASVGAMQELASRVLADGGYRAPPGKTTYSRDPARSGTSSYLERRVVDGMPYLGLGLGAQSFTHSTLSYNAGAAGKSLRPWSTSLASGRLPLQDLYHLPFAHVAAKMIAVSFYFGAIDKLAFERKLGRGLEEAFEREIDFVLERGLMRDDGRAVGLTELGVSRVNGVIALFLAPSVQRHLVERGELVPSAGEVTAHV